MDANQTKREGVQLWFFEPDFLWSMTVPNQALLDGPWKLEPFRNELIRSLFRSVIEQIQVFLNFLS